MYHITAADHIKADHPIEYFDQQKDVSLGHQRGQDGGGGYRGVTIGVRQPGVEGEQGAFDRQTHAHQADGYQQRSGTARLPPAHGPTPEYCSSADALSNRTKSTVPKAEVPIPAGS